MPEWKYTSYLKKGLSHEKKGEKCQDSVIIQEDEHCIVAALADGIGALKNSDIAASTATHTVCEWFASLKSEKISLESAEQKQVFAKTIVQKIAQGINDKAAVKGVSTATMDCTLVFVYISKDHNYAITGRLGDSAICVVTANDYIALNDSGQLANATNAVLDEDAPDHLEISVWDVETKKVYGFILTSDGLDNELYCKGSMHVNKAAEDYFNAVISPDPQGIIQRKIGELTDEEGTCFEDDISIAVINRAAKAISFPNDPTWLCICGERNRLQDTYCYKCGKDFSVLYQNVCFKDYGEKTAYFQEINKDAAKEARAIGLNPNGVQRKANVAAKANSDGFEHMKQLPLKTTERDTEFFPPRTSRGIAAEARKETKKRSQKEKTSGSQRRRDNLRAILAAGAICFVIGLVCGVMSVRTGAINNIRELSDKIDVLTNAVQSLSEEKNHIPDITESETAEDKPASNANQPGVIIPDGILVNDDGVYYWGETKDNLPHGWGVYLKAGYCYMGHFVQGRKTGEFVISPVKGPTRNIIIAYANDQIITKDMPFERYIVGKSLLNMRSCADFDSDIVAKLKEGDVVFRTGAVSITRDGMKWMEVINGDGIIGWIASEAIEAWKCNTL